MTPPLPGAQVRPGVERIWWLRAEGLEVPRVRRQNGADATAPGRPAGPQRTAAAPAPDTQPCQVGRRKVTPHSTGAARRPLTALGRARRKKKWTASPAGALPARGAGFPSGTRAWPRGSRGAAIRVIVRLPSPPPQLLAGREKKRRHGRGAPRGARGEMCWPVGFFFLLRFPPSTSPLLSSPLLSSPLLSSPLLSSPLPPLLLSPLLSSPLLSSPLLSAGPPPHTAAAPPTWPWRSASPSPPAP